MQEKAARERLQRCHLADLKLFFPLAFSHSRSPAYVCTALLVTMQIFVVVLLVVFVVSCNWPTIRVCPFCFCLHVFSIALHSYCCARLSCACVYLYSYDVIWLVSMSTSSSRDIMVAEGQQVAEGALVASMQKQQLVAEGALV